jgi:hypothetical protein
MGILQFAWYTKRVINVKDSYYVSVADKEKIDFIKRSLWGTGGGPAPPPLTAGEEAIAVSLQGRRVASGIQGGIDTDGKYTSTLSS